jgi:hypothetical protein
MRRGQRPGAEQMMLTLRRIEVQTSRGKSIAVACKEGDIFEQHSGTGASSKRFSTGRKKRRP